MSWEIQAGIFIAGLAGGAVFGVMGYFEVYGKESFNWKFFAQSLVMPAATGLASAFFATTMLEAFTFGILGKKVQELYSSRSTAAKPPAVPVKA